MEHHIDFQLPLSIAVPLVLLCLALSAYMSAAETAITGASRPRMHRLAQQGNRRATLVNKLLDRKSEAVNAVLLGNSVMNILSASLTTAVLTELFGAAGIVYAPAGLRPLGGGFAPGVRPTRGPPPPPHRPPLPAPSLLC